MSAVSRDIDHSPRYRDVFLDFLNRDARFIHDVFSVLSHDEHVNQLTRMLNLAVFLCRDRCIMPPGFAAEDRLVREALRASEPYLENRLIRWPMRESLDSYWAKKESEYRNTSEAYAGLFDPGAHEFVSRHGSLLIDRSAKIGDLIVNAWESAPDSSDYWRAEQTVVPPAAIEHFRRLPRILREQGQAVTWEAIRQRATRLAARYPRYRHLVQNVYFRIYVDEFDLAVLRNTPFARYDFGLGRHEHHYDYEWLEVIVKATGLWDGLLRMMPEDMVALRSSDAYFRFRRASWYLVEKSASLYQLREACAVDHAEMERIRIQTSILDRSMGSLPGLEAHSPEWVEAFGERLAITAELASERQQAAIHERTRLGAKIRAARAALHTERGSVASILLFVALEEERSILVHRWSLEPVAGMSSVWTGSFPDGSSITLVSPARMGRVMAAVSMSKYLADAKQEFDIVIVAGLAGGFAEAGRRQGEVLVPREVADLAIRKIGVDGTKVRPTAYQADTRLASYLGSHFNQSSWASKAAMDHGWPAGSIPSLRLNESLVCVDEVVGDDHHRKLLAAAWGGKVDAVDMESGGVMAAVRTFLQMDVAVIRVISDLADADKTDTDWRRRGMLAVSDVLSTCNWSEVIAIQ